MKSHLLGETEPVEIQITKYSLKPQGEHAKLVVEEATASREWLAVALREFLVGQSFTIPAKAGAVLKLLT